jgi:phosphate transport system substrate-binding protein
MIGRCFLNMVCLFVLMASGCKPKSTDDLSDRFNRGTIYISCDESFKPVIDQEITVYQASFPNTRIIVQYKPEADCFRDFGVDSIKMVIATRGFSEAEKQVVLDSSRISPEQETVARDLIAVIVNPAAKDSFFTMAEIRDLLSGKLKENLIPVFDGTKATSTVRFMLDSVLRGQSFGSNVVAAQSSVEVLDYVAKVPNAVGFVGFSWIGNNDDTAQLSFMKKIKLAYVESTDSAGAYVKPSQLFIYTKTYPMVRDLVYVVKEDHLGLAHAFANFLAGDRGQLIFRRSYLMPVLRTNYIRDAQLKETLTTGK